MFSNTIELGRVYQEEIAGRKSKRPTTSSVATYNNNWYSVEKLEREIFVISKHTALYIAPDRMGEKKNNRIYFIFTSETLRVFLSRSVFFPFFFSYSFSSPIDFVSIQTIICVRVYNNTRFPPPPIEISRRYRSRRERERENKLAKFPSRLIFFFSFFFFSRYGVS